MLVLTAGVRKDRTAERFKDAIERELKFPDTRRVFGEFRHDAATYNFDPDRGCR
jgi:hypothetical protein